MFPQAEQRCSRRARAARRPAPAPPGRSTTPDNGARVVTDPRPRARPVSPGALVAAGPPHEGADAGLLVVEGGAAPEHIDGLSDRFGAPLRAAEAGPPSSPV
jgi:hypothetical protein